MKNVICAASFYNRKYYLNPVMEKLPKNIKTELKAITASSAEKIRGIFIIGAYEDGSIYIEASGMENDFDYDEIGARIETEQIRKKNIDFFTSVENWYKIYVLN